MELMITKQNITPAKLDYDKQKIEAKVADDLAYFEQEMQSAKDEQELKAVRAELNKYLKSANDARKEIKKDLTAPITEFESFFKEQEGRFSEVKETINSKMETLENERKEKKRQTIMEIDGIDEYLAFYEFPQTWLNKTTSIKEISEEVGKGLVKIDQDKQLIANQADRLNFKTYDRYIEQLKTNEINTVIENMHADADFVKENTETPEPPKVDEKGKKYTITRTLTGTEEQLRAVKKYAEGLGVKWEKELYND